MKRNTKTLISFTSSELEKLIITDHSCVVKENKNLPLNLLPFHLTNIKSSVNEILSSKITKYCTDLNGIVLGYKNVKVLNSAPTAFNDSCLLQVNLNADFYLFRPKEGETLVGFVNQVSEDHIGCLVHKTFNVVVPREKDEEWCGKEVKKYQNILVQVTYTDLDSKLPYIKAKFLSVLTDADSGFSTGEENILENERLSQISLKPKLDKDYDSISAKVQFTSNPEQKKRKLGENEFSQNLELNLKHSVFDDQTSELEEPYNEYMKKVKKKKKKSDENDTSWKHKIYDDQHFQLEEEHMVNVEKNKKKKKKSKDNDCLENPETSLKYKENADQQLEEAVANSKKVKKKKNKSKENEFLDYPEMNLEDNMYYKHHSESEEVHNPYVEKVKKKKKKSKDNEFLDHPEINLEDNMYYKHHSESEEVHNPYVEKVKKKKKKSKDNEFLDYPEMNFEDNMYYKHHNESEEVHNPYVKKVKKKKKKSKDNEFPHDPEISLKADMYDKHHSESEEVHNPYVEKVKKKKKKSKENEFLDYPEMNLEDNNMYYKHHSESEEVHNPYVEKVKKKKKKSKECEFPRNSEITVKNIIHDQQVEEHIANKENVKKKKKKSKEHEFLDFPEMNLKADKHHPESEEIYNANIEKIDKKKRKARENEFLQNSESCLIFTSNDDENNDVERLHVENKKVKKKKKKSERKEYLQSPEFTEEQKLQNDHIIGTKVAPTTETDESEYKEILKQVSEKYDLNSFSNYQENIDNKEYYSRKSDAEIFQKLFFNKMNQLEAGDEQVGTNDKKHLKKNKKRKDQKDEIIIRKNINEINDGFKTSGKKINILQNITIRPPQPVNISPDTNDIKNAALKKCILKLYSNDDDDKVKKIRKTKAEDEVDNPQKEEFYLPEMPLKKAKEKKKAKNKNNEEIDKIKLELLKQKEDLFFSETEEIRSVDKKEIRDVNLIKDEDKNIPIKRNKKKEKKNDSEDKNRLIESLLFNMKEKILKPSSYSEEKPKRHKKKEKKLDTEKNEMETFVYKKEKKKKRNR